MKELSIEGKATRYDEAIKVAQRFYNNSVAITKKGLEDIFPELKESIDERIKKVIKQVLSESTTEKDECYLDNGVTQQEVFAWLEKQGEQPKKHDVCDNCDQQGCCVSPCPMKLVEKQGEQKPAWSKEDENMRGNLLGYLNGFSVSETAKHQMFDWLKSLRPQNHWKPSEVQMSMLRAIVNEPNNVGAESCHLAMESLYNDLKNL